MAYDQRRKELDQQIAELRAKIAAGIGDVGTASYILRGDTKLMDMASRAEQDAIDRKYRADQAAIERAIREAESEKQRAFQAAENKASRDNAMMIAQNRFEQAQADKKESDRKSAITHIAIEDSNIRLAEDELSRTDDPKRVAELNQAIEESKAKKEGYYRDHPDLRPSEQKVPQYDLKTDEDTQDENPQMMQSEKMTKFSTDLGNSKTIKDTEDALNGLSNIDSSMLDKSEKEKLQKAIADGKAKLASQKNAAARKAEGNKKLKNAKSAFERRQIAEEYGLKL